MFDALECLAVRLNRDPPTIEIPGYGRRELTGITLEQNEVKIYTREGTWVSYENFMVAIDSMVQV